MKKNVIIVSIIVILIIVAIVTVVLLKNKDKEKEPAIKIETEQDMKDTIDKIYAKLVGKLPSLQTYTISKEDEVSIQSFTGLKSAENAEIVVVSEPLMSSQAYSLVMVKTTKNADIEAMKKEMRDNIDTRKWICVEAESLYITNYEDTIFLIMASEDWAKPVYDEFKNLVGGKVGKELERKAEI